ncbi:hypothetical protein WMY93_000239 [Mugilogobius chulae]|uniref:Uncharacterized protein n=1 Tax=Mugilogobius chulae TaxID=88201 RepID=A0AAW0PYU9_9GOBI
MDTFRLSSLVLCVCCALCVADLNFPALNTLYNSKVKSAEWMTRPNRESPPGSQDAFTTHSGVRVTLGKRTTVPDPQRARFRKSLGHRGHRRSSYVRLWKVKQSRDFGGSHSVSDFVKAGGESYGILNGQTATRPRVT